MHRFGTAVTLGLIGGIASGVCTDLRCLDAASVTIAATTLALVLTSRWLRLGCLFVAVAAAGAGWGATARDRRLSPPIADWFDRTSGDADRATGSVVVEGVLLEDATAGESGVRLAIRVRDVLTETGRQSAAGDIHALVTGQLALAELDRWTAGRSVRAPIALRRPQVLLNFGAASPRYQALRRPFILTGTIKSAALVEVGPGAWWDELAASVRQRVRHASAQYVAPRSSEAAAIVTAILIGDRAGLSDDVERRLQAAGTYHVIAISGGNVALLTAGCFACLRLVIRSSRVVAIATTAAVITYGWIAGGDASVARAVTAAVMFLVLDGIGLRTSPVTILRVTAALLVLIDPLTVIDPGAWLSFAATLAILVYMRAWMRWSSERQVIGWVRVAMRLGTLLVAATLAAEVAVLPISAAVFSRASVAGVVLNPLAIPAMAVVQIAGLVTVSAADLPSVAAMAAWVAAIGAKTLLWSSELVDIWPWVSWRTPPTSALWMLAYYAAVVVATCIARMRWRIVSTAVAATSLLVMLTAPGLSSNGPASGRLRVTVVDVGQGDSILVQTPDGHALLVDAGGTSGPFDIGGRVVTPALWALGVRRLDWLAVTHSDRDHTGGAVSIVRDFDPREVWEGVPVPPDLDRRRLRQVVDASGIAWRTVQAGAKVEAGGVLIEAVHPPPPEWERQKVRNDDSLVLRIHYRDVDIWLTGDAGAEFERRLPPHENDAGDARIRILKVGHHGSKTATSSSFVQALRPQLAIVSVGRANLFGHPAPDVLSRLTAAGASLFRTDRDGAIVMETDGAVAKVISASGRSFVVMAGS